MTLCPVRSEPLKSTLYTPHHIIHMAAILNLKQPVNGTRAHVAPLPPDVPGHWYFPSDGSVDLAIIPFKIQDDYDVEAIPPWRICNDVVR